MRNLIFIQTSDFYSIYASIPVDKNCTIAQLFLNDLGNYFEFGEDERWMDFIVFFLEEYTSGLPRIALR